MSTTTDLTTLKINYLTQAQYDAEVQGGTVEENELYMTPASGGGGGVSDVEVNGVSVVTNDVAEITMPTNVSDLNNDSGFITTETDPTVPSWAKQASKPTYTASEVGALPDTTPIPSNTSDLYNDSGFITGVTSTSTPTASTIAEFDSSAQLNSTDMTSQEVSDFVDSLNVTGINAVDYIVEQGTDSGWSYRKWNSGKCEAWKAHSVGSVAITTSSSAYGGYRSDVKTASIPSGLFNARPMVIGQKQESQGGWLANCFPTSSTSISFYYGSGASITITDQTISLYCVGTWK